MGFLGWVGLITIVVAQDHSHWGNYHSKIDPSFGINEQIMANFDLITSYNIG